MSANRRRPWKGKLPELSGDTAIEGILSDMDGKPLENCFVFAFPTPQMQGHLPLFASTGTDKQGKFILKIAGDATYYLMARDVLGGGQLQEGGIIGLYGGSNPVGIPIKSGETIKEINISTNKMGHRGPEIIPGVESTIDLNKIGSKKPTVIPTTKPGEINNNGNSKNEGSN